jgi:hypothetical protein
MVPQPVISPCAQTRTQVIALAIQVCESSGRGYTPVMHWTRTKPTKCGYYHYRESSREQPVLLEVYSLRGALHTIPPGFGEPVRIALVSGEWSIGFAPPLDPCVS